MEQATNEPSAAAPAQRATLRPNRITQHLFDFARAHDPDDEQQLYKKLITNVRKESGVNLRDLAKDMGHSISQISRLLGPNKPLSDQNRDRFFKALGIDHGRAKLCVVWFHDPDLYNDFTALALTEALRELQNQFDTCRHSIQIDIKPSIIRELMRRAFKQLLDHQEQVLTKRDNLHA